jgi:hypothetical protein
LSIKKSEILKKFLPDYEYDKKQPITIEKPAFQHRKKDFCARDCSMTVKVCFFICLKRHQPG